MTGFYNIGKLDEIALKNFFNEAILLSYNTVVHILDVNKSWTREITKDKTISEMIDGATPSKHNVCIDRSIQHNTESYGEIGYCTIGENPEYFLYVYISLDNLKILTDKYELTME